MSYLQLLSCVLVLAGVCAIRVERPERQEDATALLATFMSGRQPAADRHDLRARALLHWPRSAR